MKTSARAIKKAIEEKQPKTFKALLEVLSPFRFRNGIGWSNCYFNGVYQGVRLHYFDSKNRQVELPSKTDVFCMPEDKEIAGRVNVDATGKEIKK
jgi:hypothetical protein